MIAAVQDGDHGVADAADHKLAQLDEPIVGTTVKTWDDVTGPGARPARLLPSPKAPTPAAWRLHRATHLPYQCWCPVCVATKRPNHHHRHRRHNHRMIPFLVADYAYGRNQGEDDLMCVLVIRIYPYGYYWSCVVDKKGYSG